MHRLRKSFEVMVKRQVFCIIIDFSEEFCKIKSTIVENDSFLQLQYQISCPKTIVKKLCIHISIQNNFWKCMFRFSFCWSNGVKLAFGFWNSFRFNDLVDFLQVVNILEPNVHIPFKGELSVKFSRFVGF